MAFNSLMHPNLSRQTCCCGHWICRAVPGRFTPQLSLTSGFKRDMTNYPHWILLFAVTGFAGRFRAELHCKLNPTSSWPFSSSFMCHVHVQDSCQVRVKFSRQVSCQVSYSYQFFPMLPRLNISLTILA